MAGARTNLKVFRVKHKMTQEEFAESFGYSRVMYIQVEKGNRDGSQDFWNALQKKYKIADSEMWELTKRDNDKERKESSRKTG